MATGHQITIVPAGAHAEVKPGGQTAAESDRAIRPGETGMPARYYIPRDDARTDLLEATAHHPACPFQGEAPYWPVKLGDDV